MNMSLRDPWLPSWYWTAPNIAFTVPDWLVINGGKIRQADDGVVDKSFRAERKNKARSVVVYRKGEFLEFPSINKAALFLDLVAGGSFLTAMRQGRPVERRDGSAVWSSVGNPPDRLKLQFEEWKRGHGR